MKIVQIPLRYAHPKVDAHEVITLQYVEYVGVGLIVMLEMAQEPMI